MGRNDWAALETDLGGSWGRSEHRAALGKSDPGRALGRKRHRRRDQGRSCGRRGSEVWTMT